MLTASEDQAIWTSKDYKNFVLDLEFKTAPGTNSGVIVYASDTKDWIPNSVEIQIADDFAEQWAKSPATWHCGAIFGHLAPTKSAVKKPGEWNRYTITCRGPMITVVLNGEKVTEMDMRKWTSAKTNPDGSEIPAWLSRPKSELRDPAAASGSRGNTPARPSISGTSRSSRSASPADDRGHGAWPLAPSRTRIWEIDFLRGVSIILMVGYHLLYDLGRWSASKSFLGFSTDLSTRAWTIAQYFFAGLFVVLSGISSTLSRGNVRRALKLAAVALLVTAATFVFDRPSAILFGILHCLAVSILIYGWPWKRPGPQLARGGHRRLGARRRYHLVLKSVPIRSDWLLPSASTARPSAPSITSRFSLVRDIPRRRGTWANRCMQRGGA